MVKAQEWLDRNYPKEERKDIKELKIDNKNLGGELDLSNFIELEKLDCSYNNLTNLTIVNCPKLREICCDNDYSNNCLTTLEINNQPSLVKLSCWGNNKLKNLIVTNNPRLNILWCSDCKIDNFTLDDNPLLAILHCQKNQLSNTNFLTNLNVKNNKLNGDLSIFSRFINLKELYLSDDYFTSSSLVKELKDYEEKDGSNRTYCNYQALRKANPNLIIARWKEEVQEKEQQLQQLSHLLFPNQPYNLTQLQHEITRLKYQELAPKAREEKTKFKQLITEAKEKVGEGSFAPIIDLLLETNQQISKVEPESNEYHQAKGQLIAYQIILEGKLTKEELQNLLTKQTELIQLEKHLESLQGNQGQVAQIQQNYPPRY